jgi:hypothetical protein
MAEPVGIQIGWIDNTLAAEFPELNLRYAVFDGRVEPTPPEMWNQLLDLSTRFRGAPAMALQSKPAPSAYRAFFRQVGLDPDVVRNPVEAIAYNRILRGGFRSVHRVADALTVAIVETHIALSVMDADTLSEPLGIRPDADGVLVLADADRTISPLFSPPPGDVAPGFHTRRLAVTAVGVAGIPTWLVNYGLWRVADLLGVVLESEEESSTR